MPTFAIPKMAAADWQPAANPLPADYVAPEGGPSLEKLNNSPVWQLVLGQMAGAPSTIPNSKDLNSLVSNILSGFQSIDPGYFGPPPEWATITAPVPGGAGWVNPQWSTDALPGGRPPPAPSTDDMGRYWFPSDVESGTGKPFDPWAFGPDTTGGWLADLQKNFPPPSAPVVNKWTPPQNWTPPRNFQDTPYGTPWTDGVMGWNQQINPRTPVKREASTTPWYAQNG